MKNIITIAKKEFSAFFYTPIAYVLGTMLYITNGLLFYYLLNATNSPQAQVEGSVMPYILGNQFFWINVFIMIPVLTMRLISEERRERTLELILTYPVTDFETILGKFSGALLFFVFLWLPSFLYVGILYLFNPPDIGPVLSSFTGVVLVGGMFIAIGLFFSTLSENQIISAMLSFGFYIGLFLLTAMEYFLPPGKFLKVLLSYLSFMEHNQPLLDGIVDTRDIVYFLSFIVFFVFLSVRSLEARKWSK
jgi:ABC-2 type transport system permease protein